MTENEMATAAAAGIIGGMITSILVIGFIMFVLRIIALWKMFVKAGQPGWKSIIPFYSDYVLFDLVWDIKNFIIYLVLAVASYCLSSFTTNTQTGEPNIVLSLLFSAVAIAYLVWYVRLQLKTAAAYGKGVGFAIGLIFLPNIFTLILGFGDAQYVGPQE